LWYEPQSVMVVHLRGRHFDPVTDQLREEARQQKAAEQCSSLSTNNINVDDSDNTKHVGLSKLKQNVDEFDGRVALYEEHLLDIGNTSDP